MTTKTRALSQILFQPITASHIESFHRALDQVAQEKKYLTMLEAPPLSSTYDFVLDMINKGNPQIVAISGNDVVGWCDICRHSWPSHAHRGSLGMGIIAPYRGKGLGQKLIEMTLEQARGANFSRIELSVYVDNLPAVTLYEKAGFVREGVERHAAYIDGRFIDAISMALLFENTSENQ